MCVGFPSFICHMSRNMTIPSRPAPPPPQAASNKITRYSPATNWDDTPFGAAQSTTAAINSGRQQHQQSHLSLVGGNQLSVKQRKAPPPRPPPPKLVPALKKPGQPQSINILSSLFGQKRNHGASKPGNAPFGAAQKGQIPIKLPPPPKLPPPLSHHNGSNYGSTASTPSGGPAAGVDTQLISFDSPPSSPTFTQKSCSDCISVDSFSSDSNYSSPNNGSMSQAESGFEDDFVSQSEHTTRSKTATPALQVGTTPVAVKDLWDMSDPFSMPPPAAKSNTVNIYAPVGSATIRAPVINSKLYESDYIDPLCNGKSIASKVQTVSMPTIIKPSTGSNSSSQKSTPVHSSVKPKLPPAQQTSVWPTSKPPAPLPSAVTVPSANSSANAVGAAYLASSSATSFEDCEESLDSLPSLPMPNIPPPPPPPCLDTEDLDALSAVAEEGCNQPYGIAMYDFSGETDEDLNFKTNDKIYLLKRLNEEWLLGRDRRGCEGMFPANYIEVRVPLPGERLSSSSPSSSTNDTCATTSRSDISNSGTNSFNHPKVQVLYTFTAETSEDLTILENQYVTVLYQITPEWLYGESNGQRGQFPANFIEYVPPNLPPMPANISNGV